MMLLNELDVSVDFCEELAHPNFFASGTVLEKLLPFVDLINIVHLALCEVIIDIEAFKFPCKDDIGVSI